MGPRGAGMEEDDEVLVVVVVVHGEVVVVAPVVAPAEAWRDEEDDVVAVAELPGVAARPKVVAEPLSLVILVQPVKSLWMADAMNRHIPGG